MTNPILASNLDALESRLKCLDETSIQRIAGSRIFHDALTAITSLRNQLTASEAREKALREELAQRPQWAGGQSPITCGPSASAGGFRAVKPTSAAHAAVLEDLARRIDDE